jgi:tetratricopeptide (TPR) repeat protein
VSTPRPKRSAARQRRPRRNAPLARFAVALVLGLAGGCHTTMQTPIRAIERGDYGEARMEIREDLTEKRSNRRFLLDRMRLAILTLADGYPQSAQVVFEDLYEKLRTRGINKDRTVASVFTYEGVRIWKGEPFEQALAMAYYAMQQAELGSWDNARAASQNALFRLRDFSESGEDDGDADESINTYEIARKSLIYERAREEGKSKEEAKKEATKAYLDHGYVTRESTFTLGYLLNAIANQQLGRSKEASDNFTRVLELKPELKPLIEAFRQDQYNTVLVVSWGLGPEKEGYGPDDAFGRFTPRTHSDQLPLSVRVDDYAPRTYRQVLDVNKMASSHMWRNLEDIRVAKSYLGSGLLLGGLLATQYGLSNDNNAATLGGLGAMGAGALMKAGAHVDTRYCDVLPQRYYVVPLKVTGPDQVIQLQVNNVPGSRLKLTGLAPPEGGEAQLRLVRLARPLNRTAEPPAWAVRGEIRYGNPVTGPVDSPPRPWLLGGRDVRPPADDVLNEYQAAGYLRDRTLAQYRELYRLEKITGFTTEDQGGYARRHILEGGDSMVAPLAGTTGFMRLFAGDWPPYRPRHHRVRSAAEALRAVEPPAGPDPVVQSDSP